MIFRRRFATLAALAFLSACGAPPIPNYAAPPGLTPQTGASITGSLIVNPNPILPNTSVYLIDVDNQRSGFGWQAWQTRTLLAPGPHLLTLGLCQCGIFHNPVVGSLTLPITAKPGENLILASSVPTVGFFQPGRATAWIQDSTGAKLTPDTPVELSPTPQTIFIPMMAPVR